MGRDPYYQEYLLLSIIVLSDIICIYVRTYMYVVYSYSKSSQV